MRARLVRHLPLVILLAVPFHGVPAGAAELHAPATVRAALNAGQAQRLIVQFDSAGAEQEAAVQRAAGASPHAVVERKAARFAAQKQAVLAAWPAGEARLLRAYSHLPFAQMQVSNAAVLDALLSDPRVIAVHEDRAVPPHLSQSLSLIGQPSAAAAGKTGAGTTVAVIDTGVDHTRAAFGSCAYAGAPGCKVVYAQDFATPDGVADDDGHGTNVAAIVLGVAPGAGILALDVFEQISGCGLCAWSSDILDAANWAIANRSAYNIAAINLSLGDSSNNTAPCGSSYYATVVANVRAAGILPAISAGNDGRTGGLSSPACAPAAVSVGAVYDSNLGGINWGSCSDGTTAADKVTCFSNSASFLTLLAPGALITAGGYTYGGTSQAAPHVAGAAAVLRAAFPGETVDQMVARLTSNGTPVTDPRNGIVKPRLNLAAAVAAGGGSSNHAPHVPSSPSPGNGATGVSGTPTLAWTGGDPDNGDTVVYDIYFGTSSSPPLAAANRSAPGYAPGTLAGGVKYYWRVLARDGAGATTSGPVWSFTTAAATYTISGAVVTGSGAPLPGVKIALSGAASATAYTDGSGRFGFANLKNGSYKLTPSLSGHKFNPSNRTVSVSGANLTAPNFVASGRLNITGKVLGSNGRGVSGVTVTLSGAAAKTAATNSRGEYKFTSLTSGAYTITPSQGGYGFAPGSIGLVLNGASASNQNFNRSP